MALHRMKILRPMLQVKPLLLLLPVNQCHGVQEEMAVAWEWHRKRPFRQIRSIRFLQCESVFHIAYQLKRIYQYY